MKGYLTIGLVMDMWTKEEYINTVILKRRGFDIF